MRRFKEQRQRGAGNKDSPSDSVVLMQSGEMGALEDSG